jgi:hypothetical protein
MCVTDSITLESEITLSVTSGLPLSRIVTTHYRYKRPPRKRKAVPLEGPVIVTERHALPSVGKRKPEPDAPLPASDRRKSAIVTVKRRRPRTRDTAPPA